MRFSVDAHAIGQHLTGNETYIRNLLASFVRLDRDAEFIAYVSRMPSAQRTEDVWSCLSRRPARPASLSHRILRGGVPKCSHCAIVGVLETREALVRATLVGMIALGQEVERPLRGPGVLFGWLVAQPLQALPVPKIG